MITPAMVLGGLRYVLFRAWGLLLPAAKLAPSWTVCLAVLAAAWLVFQAWGVADRWINPPPPMVSLDAVRATQERARREEAERAAATALETLMGREAALAALEEDLRKAQGERDAARAETVGGDTVVLRAGDRWLREWQAER